MTDNAKPPLQSAPGPSVTEPLLNAEDVAKLYKVTSRTVLNWAYSGIIPTALRVGKVVRFHSSAVAKALLRI